MSKIKLYTKDVCGKCMFIKSEIKERGLVAEEINIDKDEKAKQFVLDSGFMSMPIMEVDGVIIADSFQMIQKLDDLM